MDKNKDYTQLKNFALEQGADLFGVADIRKVKKDFVLSPGVTQKLDYAICLGVRLSASILNEISDSPTRLYFHHYRTLNNLLDQIALKVSNYIQKIGFLALPVPASQILDWEKQRGHLSHRKLASLAGLGWVGRSNLLVNRDLGAQFRLATVLTDMPLKTDKQVKDDCGKCRLCIRMCPAGAIKERKEEYDFQACFAKLKEFQKQRLADQYVCGVCVKACRGRNKV
ncbi:MAG: epoxyqueuosine reductase [Candidatus Omnitrophica bacterium]|nr:epoxyqueuosine reductase [Candidatus Omnitrophota bacterium]